jgi:hypothetical protein
MPPLTVIGRVGAVGRMNLVVGSAGARSCDAADSQPSAVSPRPCIKITQLSAAPFAGSTSTVVPCCLTRWAAAADDAICLLKSRDDKTNLQRAALIISADPQCEMASLRQSFSRSGFVGFRLGRRAELDLNFMCLLTAFSCAPLLTVPGATCFMLPADAGQSLLLAAPWGDALRLLENVKCPQSP